MTKQFEKVKNKVIDTLDKVSTPASRAGSTVERINSLVKHCVDKEVIALQLSKNSSNNNTYSTAQIDGFVMLYTDTCTKVGITKKQTFGLIYDETGSEETSLDDPTLEPKSHLLKKRGACDE